LLGTALNKRERRNTQTHAASKITLASVRPVVIERKRNEIENGSDEEEEEEEL
jgi:hypothetical protein